ncbi:hypothetical protein, partial [Enterococcus faecalis]|uniref:hypothetical protein n=1 Tax=Enterococcus faecalis TaxID=1351 RepID=UPI0022E140A9
KSLTAPPKDKLLYRILCIHMFQSQFPFLLYSLDRLVAAFTKLLFRVIIYLYIFCYEPHSFADDWGSFFCVLATT